MGVGCQSVRCISAAPYDGVVGSWPNGRLGVMRGTRAGAYEYGVTVFGEKKVRQTTYNKEVPLYSQLLKQIIPFFQGGPAPVSLDETLEIMAFMQAALISAQEGREVSWPSAIAPKS
jgi:hypothetical protein